MILLVASKLDICAKNMANYIIENYNSELIKDNLYKIDNLHLILIEEEALYAEWLEQFDVDAYVFLSKHRSEKNIPALTSHFTGNFNKAEFGGNDKELAYTFPSLQKYYMINLYEKRDKLKDYQIVIEATHHGPTSLSKPSLFIEIGSSIEQWNDRNAIEIVCDTLIQTLRDIRYARKVAIGLGGTHYPLKFNKLLLESECALGHIAPKYALEFVDKHILDQMIDKSIEKIDNIILDWKGLGREKERLKDLLSSYNLEITRV
ncbi:MAG: D-tyrosyl-tRNA(Tyr) deacylase [Candidatus Nitrosothermus koennekii]|nr:MAG: D-tyrosyl-tRNA(Tyr) deacylase [Candidatus Nitrosothermus koennekii]